MRFWTLLAPAAALGIAATAMPDTSRADAIEDFYKGRSVDLFVGSAPGGGYDTYARTLARHIHSHIPGRPNIVVKNMPGASGLILAGYMFNKAKKDGSEFAGTHNTIVVEELLGKKVQYKSTEFNWLGSANQLTSTCIAHSNSGIDTIEKAMEKELLVGATGSASSSTQLVAAFMNSLTGTQFKIIKGYPSTSSVILAMERGEVGGLCGIGWDSVQTQIGQEIKSGKIKILVQTGMEKSADLPNVPLVLDLAKNTDDRKVLEFLVARQYMGRPYIAPPGTEPAKVETLRTAFMATMKDPAYKESAKAARIPLSPITGKQVQQHVDNLFALPQSVIDKANAATQVNPKAVAEANLNWKSVKAAKIDGKRKNTITFADGGKEVKANIRGAKITVAGKKAKRGDIKAGMTCDISYLGDGDAAQSVDCQ